MQSIGREELKRVVEGGQVVLVDALSPEEFNKSHLPRAINIPVDRVAELAPLLLPDKNAFIVTYCLNFTWKLSEQVARELVKLGYRRVHDYQEGKQDWIKGGLPIEGEQPAQGEPRRGGGLGSPAVA